MYDILVHAHSGLRWIVLILMLAAAVNALMGYSGDKEFTPKDKKLTSFAMISFHLQWTIGLIMYFMSPKVAFVEGMMKDTQLRFYALEHIVAMTLVFVLLTITSSKLKKVEEAKAKFKLIWIRYALGLLIVLASIPWPFRIAGAGWF